MKIVGDIDGGSDAHAMIVSLLVVQGGKNAGKNAGADAGVAGWRPALRSGFLFPQAGFRLGFMDGSVSRRAS
jgi:hypothetical protein